MTETRRVFCLNTFLPVKSELTRWWIFLLSSDQIDKVDKGPILSEIDQLVCVTERVEIVASELLSSGWEGGGCSFGFITDKVLAPH